MKHSLLLVVALAFTLSMSAQTNIQEMYDFNRHQLTTTLEMFKPDSWGSSFFFVDIYHPEVDFPSDFYAEIARSFNFWSDSPLGDLSLHAEWNGGCGTNVTSFSYGVNNAWLMGVEYLFHTPDYQTTLTLQVLYKHIRHTTSQVPMQLTAVWTCPDLFGLNGLCFSGFADFWWEDTPWPDATTTRCVFISEPQLWYAIGQHFGCSNLSIGGEVELSSNFSGNGTGLPGWVINPAIGLKWAF